MIRRLPVVEIGAPGLVALAVGLVAFVVALLVARRRRGPAETAPMRVPGAVTAVVVQSAGLFAAGFGPVRLTLPPLSMAALTGALAVAALMTGSIALFVAATRAMGRNWAIRAQARADHQLVTTGPFARVRHPIYVALFLMLLALAVAYGHYANLVVAIPLYIGGTMMRTRLEEALMRHRFGDAYDAYAARVRRFVPGLV